jgi:hypothetical protein
MKNIRFLKLVIVLTLGITASMIVSGEPVYVNGYEKITVSTAKDSIRIISVTPNINLINGVRHTFTVKVEYVLATLDQGVIYIGFNSKEPKRYQLTGDKLIVNKGSGVHTFIVTEIPKNWYSTADFGVYVNLSPYPHESRWYPLDKHVVPLMFYKKE